MSETVSLTRQIAAVRGESLHMDRRLALAVARREMKESEARYLTESLDAAIATLEWLAANEALVRRVHAEIRSAETPTPEVSS